MAVCREHTDIPTQTDRQIDRQTDINENIYEMNWCSDLRSKLMLWFRLPQVWIEIIMFLVSLSIGLPFLSDLWKIKFKETKGIKEWLRNCNYESYFSSHPGCWVLLWFCDCASFFFFFFFLFCFFKGWSHMNNTNNNGRFYGAPTY